jgi:ribosomal protein S12 methylthiotransferase
MALQSNISLAHNKSKIGTRLKVIIDRKEDDYWIGRTEFDSPEVDPEVLISSKIDLEVGAFYNVLISGAEEYDLFAELK